MTIFDSTTGIDKVPPQRVRSMSICHSPMPPGSNWSLDTALSERQQDGIPSAKTTQECNKEPKASSFISARRSRNDHTRETSAGPSKVMDDAFTPEKRGACAHRHGTSSAPLSAQGDTIIPEKTPACSHQRETSPGPSEAREGTNTPEKIHAYSYRHETSGAPGSGSSSSAKALREKYAPKPRLICSHRQEVVSAPSKAFADTSTLEQRNVCDLRHETFAASGSCRSVPSQPLDKTSTPEHRSVCVHRHEAPPTGGLGPSTAFEALTDTFTSEQRLPCAPPVPCSRPDHRRGQMPLCAHEPATSQFFAAEPPPIQNHFRPELPAAQPQPQPQPVVDMSHSAVPGMGMASATAGDHPDGLQAAPSRPAAPSVMWDLSSLVPLPPLPAPLPPRSSMLRTRLRLPSPVGTREYYRLMAQQQSSSPSAEESSVNFENLHLLHPSPIPLPAPLPFLHPHSHAHLNPNPSPGPCQYPFPHPQPHLRPNPESYLYASLTSQIVSVHPRPSPVCG